MAAISPALSVPDAVPRAARPGRLPAATIIRKYGAKVVYGGYPCNGNMAHFLEVLDKHQAWDTLDVLDRMP